MAYNYHRCNKYAFAVLGEQIGANALLVYLLLNDLADGDGDCNPFQSVLAEKAGMSEPTVKRALKILLQAGLIAVRRTQMGNTYTILSFPE